MAFEFPDNTWRKVRTKMSLSGLMTEVMLGILLVPALALPALLFERPWAWPLGLAVLAGIFLFWLIRLQVTRIWQFLTAALILIAGPLLIADIPIVPRLLYGAGMLLLALRAFARRLRPEESQDRNPPISNIAAAIAWLLLINLLSAYLAQPALVTASFYCGVAYLLLAIIRWHRLTLASRLARFTGMPSQPTGRIRRFNYFLLAGFTGLLAVVLLLSPWMRLQDLLPWLGQALLIGLRLLLVWLGSLFTQGNPQQPQETTPAPTKPESNGLPGQAGEPPQWLVILQEIMIYVLLAGVIILLVILLLMYLYSIYRKFYENRPGGTDVRESLLPGFASQIRERLSRTQNRLARQFGQTPEQRIRRSYYRLIARLIKQGLAIGQNLTPRQIADRAAPPEASNFDELTGLYEKARYGSGICTKEDARRMLELCRLEVDK
jgi:hypothetical protein